MIIAVLNTVQIVKIANIRFKPLDILIKPLIAAGIMGVCGYFLASILPTSRVLTVLEILVCGIIYVVMIFAVRAIKREDIMNIPKGEKIAGVLEKFKLIK